MLKILCFLFFIFIGNTSYAYDFSFFGYYYSTEQKQKPYTLQIFNNTISENDFLKLHSHYKLLKRLKNPIFRGYKRQIRLAFANSVGSGPFPTAFHPKKFENMYDYEITYSQPNQFLCFMGRLNIDLDFIDGNKNLSNLSQITFGVMEEIVLAHFNFVYATIGLGVYYGSHTTSRIISRFYFGERVVLGVNFNPFDVEIFMRHFSNGDLGGSDLSIKGSSGYNFLGLALAFNFN